MHLQILGPTHTKFSNVLLLLQFSSVYTIYNDYTADFRDCVSESLPNSKEDSRQTAAFGVAPVRGGHEGGGEGRGGRGGHRSGGRVLRPASAAAGGSSVGWGAGELAGGAGGAGEGKDWLRNDLYTLWSTGVDVTDGGGGGKGGKGGGTPRF